MHPDVGMLEESLLINSIDEISIHCHPLQRTVVSYDTFTLVTRTSAPPLVRLTTLARCPNALRLPGEQINVASAGVATVPPGIFWTPFWGCSSYEASKVLRSNSQSPPALERTPMALMRGVVIVTNR
mmetsp:Transcript_27686/g.108574  ORF Transcript_27686/g.108574 Transcript_27686/m.108574 type:complete len:127 (-) Transcript_27686:1157-1537(-)